MRRAPSRSTPAKQPGRRLLPALVLVLAEIRADPEFSRITAGVQQGWHNMFVGAAAVGSKVYFPPYMRDYVGVLDTESEPLTLTRLEPDAGSGITWSSNQFLFHGAAAVGTKVYFSPYKSADVVVLQTTDNSFTKIDTGLGGTTSKYNAAVACNGKVWFSPLNVAHVAYVDPAADTYHNDITTNVPSGTGMYAGCACVDHGGGAFKVYFAPKNQDNILMVDTTSKAASTILATEMAAAGISGANKYGAVAAVGTKIYFGPKNRELSRPRPVSPLTLQHTRAHTIPRQ